MQIVLNGSTVTIAEGAAVTAAVVKVLTPQSETTPRTHVSGDSANTATVDVPSDGLAVAVNGEVVPRSQWDTHTLNAEDNVDVLTAFVGG